MADIESELERMTARIDFGREDESMPDSVLRRVAALPSPRRRLQKRRGIAAIVATGIAAVSVPVAPAVADWLGIGGVEVRTVPDEPGTTLPPPRHGELGRDVDEATAEAALGAEISYPTVLGPPDAIWLDDRGRKPVVNLDYGAVLVTEFRQPLAREVVSTKLAGPGVRIESVLVSGLPGLWLEGAHGIALRGGNGDIDYVTMRRAANALVWERAGVTFRVETEGTLAEALRIAESIP